MSMSLNYRLYLNGLTMVRLLLRSGAGVWGSLLDGVCGVEGDNGVGSVVYCIELPPCVLKIKQTNARWRRVQFTLWWTVVVLANSIPWRDSWHYVLNTVKKPKPEASTCHILMTSRPVLRVLPSNQRWRKKQKSPQTITVTSNPPKVSIRMKESV